LALSFAGTEPFHQSVAHDSQCIPCQTCRSPPPLVCLAGARWT
jgi:hypothetical protein